MTLYRVSKPWVNSSKYEDAKYKALGTWLGIIKQSKASAGSIIDILPIKTTKMLFYLNFSLSAIIFILENRIEYVVL